MRIRKNTSIKKQIFVPIILIFLAINVVIYYFISSATKENIIDNSIINAKNTVSQYKTLRKYYAGNVVGVVKKNSEGKIKINFDHAEKSDTIPLPATMIHDLSSLVSQSSSGMKLKLYSDYPFPNRKDTKLDDFSTHAMKTFREGKIDEPVIRQEVYENVDSLRVAIPDFMVAQGCVNCHNTRADTPKNDWKMGDVRGTLEVIIPIEEQLASINAINMKIFASILFLGFVVLGILYFYFAKVIINPLQLLEDGIDDFFKFLNQETKEVKAIEIIKDDEIGKMSSVINENIAKATNSLKTDHEFIEEVKTIVENIKQGYLDKKLNQKIDSKNLEELRHKINEMIEVLNTNISKDTNQLLKVLDSYTNQDYTTKVENDNGKIAVSINKLGENITKMLTYNKRDGLILDNSSVELLNNVQTLNNITTDTAARLEEASASLEEMTDNIRTNASNITQMGNFAQDLNKSAEDGKVMANKTTTAMDDINEQVTSINEAISVIDQIAFQTNILSLNAAVEAATAGEAGKGFAVVAQEVRNLASRSAEAAKEIKDIVEKATLKSNEGKVISDNMINGYNELNETIKKTLELIQTVSVTSQEQQIGIEQINSAINSLDKQTQENASVANNTQEIARQTSSLATHIVESSDDKNFIGKDSINISQD